jgi:hypothetical protein
MHSQLGNVFFRMEVLDDPIDIYTPITNIKSSILSKRNQHKKVHWEESVIDNEYKHTIRKTKHLAHLTQKLAKLQAKIIEQEDLIERQVEEVTRLTGLWARAQEGEIPEGFERKYRRANKLQLQLTYFSLRYYLRYRKRSQHSHPRPTFGQST